MMPAAPPKASHRGEPFPGALHAILCSAALAAAPTAASASAAPPPPPLPPREDGRLPAVRSALPSQRQPAAGKVLIDMGFSIVHSRALEPRVYGSFRLKVRIFPSAYSGFGVIRATHNVQGVHYQRLDPLTLEMRTIRTCTVGQETEGKVQVVHIASLILGAGLGGVEPPSVLLILWGPAKQSLE